MIDTRPRILCIDDEPEVLKFLEAVLVPKGYEVIKAGNGEEALEKLKEERVDLVISDVKMPKMDGLEVCRRIKKDERYRSIPVIIITGLSAKEDRIEGIEAGAEDFISKPIDQAEVLARIKMLLKAKGLHERRIGELLIEMGFITEEQLQKALKVAEEQNMKVGEALHSMGALDKDHIYWVLSNQMNMNYVELSPEMIDKELIAQFSIDALEQLKCLPLFETVQEIHFAISDPTDHKMVKKVKSLKPGKTIQLHLGLPEKIMDILNFVREEFYPQLQKIIEPEEKYVHPSAKMIESHEISKIEYFWSDLIAILLSMPQGETYWLYKNPHECRLISQEGKKSETLREYPEEIYLFVKERLKQKIASQHLGGEIPFFLQEKSTGRQGAFKLWEVGYLDRDMIRIERIPAFSREKFMISYPQVSGWVEDLQHLFSQHHRLLIGGRDKLFVKQCCYSLLKENDTLTDFPPAIFIESKIEIYFSKVAQLSAYPFDIINLLEQFKEAPIPFIFYETKFPEITPDEQNLSKISSGICKNIIWYFPFESLEGMKKALSVRQEWHQAGFKALFFSPDQLQSI
jgi:CheY-like chemotaxis protein